MMSVIKLKTPAAPRSPAREALATAIAAHTEAKAYLDGLKSSLEYDGAAAAGVRNARKALEAAEEALEQAKGDTVRSFAGNASQSAPLPLSIREARASIVEAEEALDAARTARDETQAEIAPAENNLSLRETALRSRAIDVLKEEIGPWAASYFAEVRRLKRELEHISGEVNWLLQKGVFTCFGPEAQYAGTQRSGEANWESELARLMSNADAPAPAESFKLRREAITMRKTDL